MTLKRIIIPVNASSLKLTHCKRKYFNTVCAGLISLDERDTLDLGTAIHRVAELKTKGMPVLRSRNIGDLHVQVAREMGASA